LLILSFGGFLAGPADAVATGPGKLEVCKSAANGMSGTPFNFTIDGTPRVINGGNCTGPLTVAAGAHTITETPPAGVEVQRIQANRVISKNVAGGTVTVNVKAGSTEANETLVTFTNRRNQAVGLKICKQTPDAALVGTQFSFSRNGGPVSSIAAGSLGSPICGPIHSYPLDTQVTIAETPTPNVFVSAITVSDNRGSNVNTAAGTVTATIGAGVTVVTYTNNVVPPENFGWIEVCKYPGDSYVNGNFDYTITAPGGFSRQRTVLTGQCSEPIQVPAGNVSVAEAARFPYYVHDIYVAPSGRLVTKNLTNQTATVVVPKGDESTETIVVFVNKTRLGNIKVCKTLHANASALAGRTFYFTVTDINGPRQVSVVAGAAGTTACYLDFHGLPIGSPVSITEQSTDNVKNTAVTVTPASQNTGSAPPTANLIVGSGVTTATFTNQALGTIEVCKKAYDPETATQTFQFSVNGGAAFNVKAGQCSPPIPVPAGTATVFELAKTNFNLVSVTAVGPSGESRVLVAGNPVTVSVPFGGVENETLVTFKNAVNTGRFKICKTSSDPGLDGITFAFTWTGKTSGSANLKPGECSAFSGSIPVVDPSGNPYPINVTEAPFAGTQVTSITIQNGAITASNNSAGTATINIKQGTTILTYNNERTPLVP